MRAARPLHLVLLLALLLSACGGDLPAETTGTVPLPPDATAQTGAPASTDSAAPITVYFSDPNASGNRGGPDADLAAAIDAARLTVDVAIYDLNLWSIRDALLDAHRRGVQVRMATESDNRDRAEFNELADAGIPILGDRREGLMHHKFVVIDGFQVWTGSMNFTLGSAYHGNNNLLRIDSTRLAENYTHEFEEMFTDDLFGDASARGDTPNPTVTLDGVLVENYFSPDDGVEQHIVDLINNAEESVYFMTFSFTSNAIGAALLLAQQRGVEVAGVMETTQVDNSGSEYESLRDAGIDVRLDGIPGDMHHKVFIIDGSVVVTGSYNYSRAAEETNDENVLIIYSAGIAELYMQELVDVMLAAGD
ncbi:MAG: phospholipase [Anaerolineae bacterium]|nr:MAG: phospholipase [Anaerolineae bacterium]